MNITINCKSIAATIAGAGIALAALMGIPATASTSTDEFAAQWEADVVNAEEMLVEARGKMITFLDHDTDTQVTYNTTNSGGIYRSEMTGANGESGYALTDAEGARFSISSKSVTASIPEVGTFKVARAPMDA